MSEKLKPCPFCGGDAKFYLRTTCCKKGTVGFDFEVTCKKCRIALPKQYTTLVGFEANGEINFVEDGRKEAIDDWNSRADHE